MKLFLFLPIFVFPLLLKAQEGRDVITEEETSRIIHILASDSLKGRGNGQPGVLMAAKFIAKEFKQIGLSKFNNYSGYYFPFTTVKKKRKKDESKPPVSVEQPTEEANPNLLYNIVGVLPGKSKPAEIVVFSAHYDHLGVKRSRKDSIWNGANDNASGTTAILMLAKYFAARNDNERTLIFCAFAGEELGMLGSADFIQYLDGALVVADVNIEMIGMPQFGKKTVIITGAENSTFADIVNKNTTEDELKIIHDPDPDKHLYQRSDNYIFARAGAIGHSIMASTDEDKCYHDACDEVGRMDIPNMTDIIHAIAKGTSTLVDGTETPRKK